MVICLTQVLMALLFVCHAFAAVSMRPLTQADFEGGTQAALQRINAYRRFVGLAAVTENPAHSAQAEKHVRYRRENCRAGRDATGHREHADWPYFTPEGNEAARYAVLSYQNGPPVVGVESLIAVPFHRASLLNPRLRSVGIAAFHDREREDCSIVVVMLKEHDTTAAVPSGPVLFPPPDAELALRLMQRERPEPRPLVDRMTGLAVSVHLPPKDGEGIRHVEARLRERGGQDVPIWLSFPGQPAVTPDRLDLRIYAQDSHEQVLQNYQKNLGMILLLPQIALARAKDYDVFVRYTTGEAMKDLHWTFRISAPREVPLRPSDAFSLYSFLAHATDDGDTVRLGPGQYGWGQKGWRLPHSLRLAGAGPEKTAIVFRNQAFLNVGASTAIRLERLKGVFATETHAVVARDQARVVLDSVTVQHDNPQTPVAKAFLFATDRAQLRLTHVAIAGGTCFLELSKGAQAHVVKGRWTSDRAVTHARIHVNDEGRLLLESLEVDTTGAYVLSAAGSAQVKLRGGVLRTDQGVIWVKDHAQVTLHDTRLETTCRVETCRFLTGKDGSKSFLHRVTLLNPSPLLYGLAFFDEASALIDTGQWEKLQARTALGVGKDVVLELKQTPHLPDDVKLSNRESLVLGKARP
jgi:uncharacterized protein YkwD